MRRSYGKFIEAESKVILRALAISLELGVMVTIALGKSCMPLLSGREDLANSRTIVYIGTHNNGESEILKAFQY